MAKRAAKPPKLEDFRLRAVNLGWYYLTEDEKAFIAYAVSLGRALNRGPEVAWAHFQAMGKTKQPYGHN